MSVDTAVTLPAQPSAGAVTFLPLGGDGYTAPFAAYSVNGFADTGDASGTFLRLTVNMDARFCSLVAFINGQIEQGVAADAAMRLTVTGGGSPEQVDQGIVTAVPTAVVLSNVAQQWSPVPFVLPGGTPGGTSPRIFVRVANVDGDVVKLDALIYLFNIRVRETTPMGPLLWARGAT